MFSKTLRALLRAIEEYRLRISFDVFSTGLNVLFERSKSFSSFLISKSLSGDTKMMRAYKTLFTLFVVSTALVCAPTMVDALTDFSTYTLQRNATGAGPNITVAKTKAHEAFQAAIAEIEASLPLNHFIIDITITAEGPVLPTIYTINYEVLIYVDCDVPSGGDPDIG